MEAISLRGAAWLTAGCGASKFVAGYVILRDCRDLNLCAIDKRDGEDHSLDYHTHIYTLEDGMSNFFFRRGEWTTAASALLAVLLIAGELLVGQGQLLARQAPASGAEMTSETLLDGFRHVEAASVSDAVEQVTGRKMYMSHQMRPIFNTKFAGFALTVLLKREEGHQGSQALTGMLAAIDQGNANSVYVMVVQDGVDIAGMGGLMGTAMAARDFSGAVIDGGVRDVAYLRKIAFPVYAKGIVPSTSVNHYRFAGANIPVVCDGVPVSPGDIIVADQDGVVVVPRAQAAAVLALAQKMDFQEHSMYPYIEKYKSIEEAVRKFGRL